MSHTLLLTPKLNHFSQLDLTTIHPGFSAQRAIKSGSKKAKDFAYKEAMRQLQDEYFKHVGLANGQLRYGPRQRRLSRKEWHAQKRYALLIRNIFNQKNSLINSLSSKLEKARNILIKVFPSKVASPIISKSENQEKSQ